MTFFLILGVLSSCNPPVTLSETDEYFLCCDMFFAAVSEDERRLVYMAADGLFSEAAGATSGERALHGGLDLVLYIGRNVWVAATAEWFAEGGDQPNCSIAETHVAVEGTLAFEVVDGEIPSESDTGDPWARIDLTTSDVVLREATTGEETRVEDMRWGGLTFASDENYKQWDTLIEEDCQFPPSR